MSVLDPGILGRESPWDWLHPEQKIQTLLKPGKVPTKHQGWEMAHSHVILLWVREKLLEWRTCVCAASQCWGQGCHRAVAEGPSWARAWLVWPSDLAKAMFEHP